MVINAVANWLSNPAFLPHGYCLRWEPGLLWSLVVANAVIGLAYYSIPVAIGYFLRRHKDLKFNWIFAMFAVFIFACGTTHFIDMASIWFPIYRFDAVILDLTAAVSIVTAVVMWPLIPKVSLFLKQRQIAMSEQSAANELLQESLELLQVRQKQLAKSERQFRLTLTNAPIGLAIVGLDGRFITVNTVLCAMLDYSESDLLTKNFQEITHPDDLQGDLAYVQEMIEGRRDSYRMDKRYINRRGEIIYVQLDVSILRNDAYEPQHFISQIQNITHRKGYEDALLESERRLQTLLGTLHTAVIVQGPDAVIRFANPAAVSVLGLDGEQLTGKSTINPYWRFVREDGTPMPISEYPVSRVMQSKLPLHDNVVGILTSAMSPMKWLLVNAIPEICADGSIRQVVVSFIDISERKRLAQELEQQARTDTLTGLANRRHFTEMAELELLRSRRHNRPLSALFLDIDHFKLINDRHGHPAGDIVLRHVAEVMRKGLREIDVAGRLGGEEFCVLLPECSHGEAVETAERLRNDIAATRVALPVNVPVQFTASIGVATLDLRTPDVASLIDHADKAMYRAKDLGRNQVQSWPLYYRTSPYFTPSET